MLSLHNLKSAKSQKITPKMHRARAPRARNFSLFKLIKIKKGLKERSKEIKRSAFARKIIKNNSNILKMLALHNLKSAENS
jgi:hypothetical protein